MNSYIIFFRFTDKGIAGIRESPARVAMAKEKANSMGVAVKQFFALTGAYDTMFVVEAPSEESVARVALAIASLGNVRTEVVRAFNEAEFSRIVAEI
ncbi:MAG TPA: GYD domain-containing protein [Desulfuromonadaceae bacterium]